MVAVGHWMACFWAMIGEMQGGDREGSAAAPNWIYVLDQRMYDPQRRRCTHLDKYANALYWSIVTMTSVGYGDIVPQNTKEVWAATFIMLVGASFWAYIIGSACGIIATLNVEAITHRQTMDQAGSSNWRVAYGVGGSTTKSHCPNCAGQLNYMMADRHIPQELRERLRTFFRQTRQVTRVDSYKDLIRRMSPTLKGEVAGEDCRWIHQLWYLAGASNKFVVEIVDRLAGAAYCPQEEVHMDVAAGGQLTIVNRGVASHNGRVRVAGGFWGEDFILSTPRFKDLNPGFALTYLETLNLTRPNLVALLKGES